MAIITIFSALYCQEKEISSKLGEKLGYKLISDELISETSRRFNVSENKLKGTLNGEVPFLNNITHEREKNWAYLKLILTELIQKDNAIYTGYASHLMPRTVSHILKIGLVANREFRIKRAMNQDDLSEQNAEKIIRKDDLKRSKWVQYLFDLLPWDENLYDIVIPMHNKSAEEAVALIVENAGNTALETTAVSQKTLNDFLLACQVNVPLVENGYDVNVMGDSGNITISLKEYVIRFENIKNKLRKIASAVSGVKQVEVVMEIGVRVPSRYDELKAPPRFLLVDDEKEYVQTLSDRLKTREIDSAIAYDGEEALSYLEKDEPEVMVVDLKMPGINGMEVLRKVKKERPHVEVIILTGHGSEKDEALAMELGAFAYLEKPVDIEVLTRIMKEAYAKINAGKDEG
jgi:two-component system response regulator CpxR